MYYGMKGQLKEQKYEIHLMKEQLHSMSESFKQLGAILTQVAVQDTRLSMLEKHIDEIRHGKGMID